MGVVPVLPPLRTSNAPAQDAFSITPNTGATNFPTLPNSTATVVTRGIYVGTSGNLEVVMQSGTIITFSNVPVGILNISVSQVISTSTTASNLIGLL